MNKIIAILSLVAISSTAFAQQYSNCQHAPNYDRNDLYSVGGGIRIDGDKMSMTENYTFAVNPLRIHEKIFSNINKMTSKGRIIIGDREPTAHLKTLKIAPYLARMAGANEGFLGSSEHDASAIGGDLEYSVDVRIEKMDQETIELVAEPFELRYIKGSTSFRIPIMGLPHFVRCTSNKAD